MSGQFGCKFWEKALADEDQFLSGLFVNLSVISVKSYFNAENAENDAEIAEQDAETHSSD